MKKTFSVYQTEADAIADRYSVKYYEYFKAIGWRLIATDNDYTKEK